MARDCVLMAARRHDIRQARSSEERAGPNSFAAQKKVASWETSHRAFGLAMLTRRPARRPGLDLDQWPRSGVVSRGSRRLPRKLWERQDASGSRAGAWWPFWRLRSRCLALPAASRGTQAAEAAHPGGSLGPSPSPCPCSHTSVRPVGGGPFSPCGDEPRGVSLKSERAQLLSPRRIPRCGDVVLRVEGNLVVAPVGSGLWLPSRTICLKLGDLRTVSSRRSANAPTRTFGMPGLPSRSSISGSSST